MNKLVKNIFSSLAYCGIILALGASNTVSNHSLLLKSQSDLKAAAGSISGEDVFKHLKAFQEIADQNAGNRSAGTLGHSQSAHYVADLLLKAGYTVEMQPFDFLKFSKLEPGNLANEEVTFVDETDFNVMPFSPSGSVTAELANVDLALGLGNESTSGCEAEDFENFPEGKIALIQRGACSFQQKAENAEAAGAVGVIIFNQGNEETRTELIAGTLTSEAKVTIPVLATGYALGEKFSEQENMELTIKTTTEITEESTFNVIAETKTGNADNVVMVGAHLDGVEAGPGINDNGSGSAGILEVALRLSKVETNNKVRFAWWGAEELGLIGSTKYVESLSEEEKKKIALYLNFDMIGSKNYIIGVFDGSGERFGAPGPVGSTSIENLFHMYFAQAGVEDTNVELSGRSDYAPFAAVDIPVGGLFTGAEGTKTQDEAAIFGGTAGEAYDACYHKECDTQDNVNLEALEINTNAIAIVTLNFAYSTLSIEAEKEAEESLENANFLRSAYKKVSHDSKSCSGLNYK